MRNRLGGVEKFPTLEIELSHRSSLSKAYQWGHVAGFCYQLDTIPGDEQLELDLLHMLEAYQRLVEKDGYTFHEESTHQSETVMENRVLRLHERLERVSADSRKVKNLKGFTCEVCNFDFENFYGSIGRKFAEVHHLSPFSELKLGEISAVDLIDDFAILCTNCHRMIHRMDDPADVQGLRALIRNGTKLDNQKDTQG